MREWYFGEMDDFRAEVGFETCFVVTCEGRVFPHVWRVAEVIHETRLAYGWRYEGFAGDSVVTWDLADAGAGTHLKLTHEILKPFPQDDPVFSHVSCAGGWHYLLHENLQRYLAK
ncbi:MAG: ATPase [Verrucomicrobiales bacterium]|nr:ATPase [Verrucomicrobiales bacterium]|tara:strand:+ start:873 stop:1217 length:345 start_codon:yes stop_codon:yes gene_type:complete